MPAVKVNRLAEILAGECVTYNLRSIYGYVGNIPVDLATATPATKSDVMGGRAMRDASGALVAPKFPVFDTQDGAIEFARSKGYEPNFNLQGE